MVEKIKLETRVKKVLGDMMTPVSIYLRIRDKFPHSVLLESTDYYDDQNCFSFVCCDPIASFTVKRGVVTEKRPDGSSKTKEHENYQDVFQRLKEFSELFDDQGVGADSKIPNGVFGYITFDGVQYFEDIKFSAERDEKRDIPDIQYRFFRYIIAFDHYRNEVYLLENDLDCLGDSRLEELEYQISSGEGALYRFRQVGDQRSNMTDPEHEEMILKCKEHIYRGDVFQIVPSRRFEQDFEGDDFNVYRALRVINPSPYLFYFDFGSFRIFGSSPEAELITEDGTATIFPIAGTYKRSGNDEEDERQIAALLEDPKENAENVMLGDIAINDLSKHCDSVEVETYKEAQRYSHVIHLVSKVNGKMRPDVSSVNLLADTFPAGTLSGAPKYRAMELIDRYERGNRGYYGGAIGIIGLNGDSNHAIMIRTFMSKDGTLYRQAGGGVVADSVPEREVQEVNNKLGALKAALDMAETL